MDEQLSDHELIDMLDAASRDESLADGMLYRKAADRIRELERPDCKWKPPTDDWYGNTWSGSCGTEWKLEADGPKENSMNFCPECGGRLIIEEQSDELGI